MLYRLIAEGLPDAWIEDPALDASRPTPVLAPHRDRITWDAPIHSVADVLALPFPPRMLNVKPSRFGTSARAAGLLRPLREQRDRQLRRRPDRARRRPRADPIPRVAVSPRHAQRRRPRGLQPRAAARRAARKPARAGSERHRLPLGVVSEPVLALPLHRRGPLRRPRRQRAPQQRRVPRLPRVRTRRLHRPQATRRAATLALDDFGIVVAELKISYRSPGQYGERIETTLRPACARASPASRTDFEMRVGERLLADGYSVQVIYDREERRPMPIPPALRERLAEERRPRAAAGALRKL